MNTHILARIGVLGALVPLLLAPVRFQQGNDVLMLQPTTAPQGVRGGAAVALPSPTVMGPTVIEVSPTRAAMPSVTLPAEGTANAEKSSAKTKGSALPAGAVAAASALASARDAAGGMTPKQAALCVRALGMVTDLASASMKASGRENLVELSIATAVAQVQAAQGQWPNLEGVEESGLPWFIPYRAELKQSLSYTHSFCTNPAAPRRSGWLWW